ncbi:tachylectin-related carbohydrate-binding protein [Kutzneria sp. NPDC052558]|uniref:tachylectin-related carbohydrate-binding protein n=1 Tax=Kutzneria sp. NPDC052558 TaxID=3364121 RepID=UPI0037CCB25C
MRTHGHRFAATVLAATATLSIASPISIAHADSATTCTGPTQIVAALPDGSTRIYDHTDPVGGSSTWTGPTVVGGPSGGLLLGGPDGDVYNLLHNGEFRRYHWNGTGWDPYLVIGQNWTGWDSPSVRNRITVDSLGNIYEVPNDGNLHVARYDPAAGKIVEREVDTNWGNYDLILAAGPGVLYARDPSLNSGQLYRYRYDANSQRWLQRQKVLSSGWNIFSGMFSPGGDTLYGHTVDPHGDMLWYHYTDATGVWAGGNNLGWGWDPSWLIASVSNTCSTPMTLPGKPHVTPVSQAATTLLANASGRLEYYYVGKDGSVVAGDQTNVNDNNTAQFAALPGYSGSTGRVAAALNDNGGAQTFALGGDSEIRGSAQAAIGGTWPTLSPAGGYFPTEPTIVRKPDNTLVAFGLDDQGGLWFRPQATKNGELTAWQSLGSTGMRNTLTAVVQGSLIRLFALDANGRLNTATLTGATLSSWTQLAGLVGSTLPSVVTRSDGTTQVFALNDSDKTVRAIRQNADGTWPTTWTTTPSLTAAGAPSASLTADNSVEVTVKANDGYIYRTGPVAPGNPAFRDWSVVDPAHKAGTDPTTALLTTGIWVVVFRDPDDRPILFHTLPSNPQAKTAIPALVGGPLPPRIR